VSESATRRTRRAVDGLLLLDKPSGGTSNAVLQRVKWLFQARKAGHTGSLDPLASGMLPICFGEATKFAGYLLDAPKTYHVRARFGARTDTGDADGVVIETRASAAISRPDLERSVASLRGSIQQVPPMYSALKQQGQRLYELARAGREVPRKPRSVQIYEFTVESFDPVTPEFRVRCSKGTYIRTLIEDLAQRLDSLAHVMALRRLGVEPFDGQPMTRLEQIEAAAGPGPEPDLAALDAFLQPLDAVLPQWPAVELDQPSARRVRQGGHIDAPGGLKGGLVRLYAPGWRFIGVGEVQAGGLLAPRRLVAG
jgi:tRNA pseudouridine55 synthase